MANKIAILKNMLEHSQQKKIQSLTASEAREGLREIHNFIAVCLKAFGSSNDNILHILTNAGYIDSKVPGFEDDSEIVLSLQELSGTLNTLQAFLGSKSKLEILNSEFKKLLKTLDCPDNIGPWGLKQEIKAIETSQENVKSIEIASQQEDQPNDDLKLQHIREFQEEFASDMVLVLSKTNNVSVEYLNQYTVMLENYRQNITAQLAKQATHANEPPDQEDDYTTDVKDRNIFDSDQAVSTQDNSRVLEHIKSIKYTTVFFDMYRDVIFTSRKTDINAYAEVYEQYNKAANAISIEAITDRFTEARNDFFDAVYNSVNTDDTAITQQTGAKKTNAEPAILADKNLDSDDTAITQQTGAKKTNAEPAIQPLEKKVDKDKVNKLIDLVIANPCIVQLCRKQQYVTIEDLAKDIKNEDILKYNIEDVLKAKAQYEIFEQKICSYDDIKILVKQPDNFFNRFEYQKSIMDFATALNRASKFNDNGKVTTANSSPELDSIRTKIYDVLMATLKAIFTAGGSLFIEGWESERAKKADIVKTKETFTEIVNSQKTNAAKTITFVEKINPKSELVNNTTAGQDAETAQTKNEAAIIKIHTKKEAAIIKIQRAFRKKRKAPVNQTPEQLQQQNLETSVSQVESYVQQQRGRSSQASSQSSGLPQL